ncbi:MAG: S49 family peptidase [Phycisphaerales bacterium JB063]
MSSPDNPQPTGSPQPPINPAGTSSAPPPPPGYVPAVYVQQPSTSGGFNKILIYVLLVLLLFSVTLNIYLRGPIRTIANVLTATGPTEVDYTPAVNEQRSEDRVAVVVVSGTIDDPTAEYCRQAFAKLEQNPPKAVVLRVESGGGGVTASDQIWHYIHNFRDKHPEVPVVASFGNVAASGGYYIAMPCDYIFHERTGITGSIGVLAQVPAFGGLIERYGVEMNMVIAQNSPNKDDANDLFVEWYDDEGNLTEDGQEAVAVLGNLVDDAYETFFEVVRDGRTNMNASITEDELRAAATGKIFIGEEAVEAKLVDAIGYLDDAITYAAAQAGITGEPDVTVMREPEAFSVLSLLAKREGADFTNLTGEDLHQLFEETAAVRLEYRWASP